MHIKMKYMFYCAQSCFPVAMITFDNCKRQDKNFPFININGNGFHFKMIPHYCSMCLAASDLIINIS